MVVEDEDTGSYILTQWGCHNLRLVWRNLMPPSSTLTAEAVVSLKLL